MEPGQKPCSLLGLIAVFGGSFVFLSVIAYVIHDPLDRSLRDPYDNRDVARDHAAKEKLSDGSCLELVGRKRAPVFALLPPCD